jgi:predicted permease
MTLFIIMGVGFFLCRVKRLSQQTISQVSYVQVNIVVPCLIFNSLRIDRDVRVIREMGLAAFATFLYYAIAILLAARLFPKQPGDTRAVLQFGVIYANVAFMGFPLIEAVYGKEALVFAAVSLAVFTLFQWTHGIFVMGGRGHISVRSILLSPGVVALLSGFCFFMIGFDVFDRFTGPLGQAITFFANLNTPLALMLLGAQMANSDYKKLFASKTLYAASAIRLIGLPLLAALIMIPIGLPPMVYCALVTLCATPTAGLTSIFAERYQRDVPTAAQTVTLTTLFSILTLPLFAAAGQAFMHR